MKTVGLIGGLGPESTVDYYRSIIERHGELKPNQGNPSIIINSVDLHKMIELVTAGRFAEIVDYLSPEIDRLAQAGANFGALTANTPHIIFNDLRRRSRIPLISIVEATCEAAKTMGHKRVALFGTRFTMQGKFYPEVFEGSGVDLVLPSSEEQDYIHDKYMNELLKNLFLPETRKGFLAIAERLKREEKVEGLILGGTEIPLLIKADQSNLPLLDTTRIHVDAIVQALIA